VVDGYTLAFAALMLSTGALSDRIGASRAYTAGLAVFTAASMACGMAPGLGVLVAARVVQGVAAAVMLPASLSLLRQAYPDAVKRARAIAVWTAGGAAAVAAGPVVGGVLTTAWSWRAIFFVNLPAGLAALALLSRTPRSPRQPAPLDLPGQLTAVIALAALAFGVIEGGADGLGALVVAALAMAAFLVVEARHPHPMVPLGLFRTRAIPVTLAAGFALNAAFYGTVFVLSLFFQQMRGQSALTAGLMFVPMTALIAVVNLGSGRLTARYGARPPLAAGQFLMAAGLLLLLAVGTDGPAPLLAALLIPVGLGGALAAPPLTTALLDAVPGERTGLAAGILNAARQIGGGLSVAVFGALVADRAAFLPGMRTSLLLAAGLLSVTAVATLTLLRQQQPR
jgi:DHA2 family methylenomycin A resistance protein-like MFS transporter